MRRDNGGVKMVFEDDFPVTKQGIQFGIVSGSVLLVTSILMMFWGGVRIVSLIDTESPADYFVLLFPFGICFFPIAVFILLASFSAIPNSRIYWKW